MRGAQAGTIVLLVAVGMVCAPAAQTLDPAQVAYTYIKGAFSPAFTPPAPGTYTLPVIDTVSDHPVLDPTGRRVNLLDLKKNKIAVISFLYTSCSEASGCPLALGVLQHLDRMLAGQPELAQRVALLSVSFDPERDTPERMAVVHTSLGPTRCGTF